jgi:hypothetical protein
MRFLLREGHATHLAALAGLMSAFNVRGRTRMRHRRSPWLATPDGMPVRRIPISRWKQVQRAIIGGLALLALTSPADAKPFLQALFGPPKVQTRSTAIRLPAFLRALFTPHQPQYKLRRAGRLGSPLVARRAPDPLPVRSATARFLTPASLGRHPARVTPAPLPKPASLGAVPAAPDEGIAAAFMRDVTLQRGDIVVFPDGPRVFNGTSRNTLHQMSDFEDLRASSLVSERTRQEVMAATEAIATDEPRLSFTARPSNGREP